MIVQKYSHKLSSQIGYIFFNRPLLRDRIKIEINETFLALLLKVTSLINNRFWFDFDADLGLEIFFNHFSL